jgi:hypothetical protein
LRAGFLTLYLLLVHQHVWAQCRTEVTEAPILRLESRAEQIADLRLICAGLAPPGTANFTVTLTSPIATPITGVRLEVGEPPVSYNPTLEGTRQIRFSNVTLPAGVDSAVRITGLRVDLAGFDATLRANPLAVRTTLSAGTIPVTNPELIAGYPASSLSARLIDASTNQPTTSLNLRPGSSLNPSHLLHFRERFRGAFRTPSQEPITPHGTLLVAEFSSLPVGAGISVALADGLRYARLVASEANPIPIVQPAAQYFPLPITNGRATAVWEVTENPTPGITYAFSIVATGPAVSAAAGLRYGPTQSPALPRFDTAAKLDPLDCPQNCFSIPAVISVTRRFGQPPPSSIPLPIEFVGPPFGLRAEAYAESSPPLLTIDPFGQAFDLRFQPTTVAPGVYTTIVGLRPQAGGPSQYTVVVLTVTPPLAGEDPPPMCTPLPPVPTILRAEGAYEPLPAIVVECQGGVPGSSISGWLSANMNSDFASRLIDTQHTEALLVVGESADPVRGVDEFPVRRSSNFPSTRPVTGFVINFSYRVPADRRIRLHLRNLRISAASLADHWNSPLAPVATMAVSAGGGLAMRPAVLSLGSIQRGLEFGLHAPDGRSLARLTNPGQYQLRFREGSPAAFRRRNVATTADNPGALANQTAPDNNPATETMFYSASRGNAGLATNGTRVNARFSGIPADARLLVTVENLRSSTSTVRARFNSSRHGSFAPPSPSAETIIFEGIPYAVTELTFFDGWSRDANWEIFGADPTQLEELRFGVLLVSPAPVSPVAVFGTLSPIDNTLTPAFVDSSPPFERRSCTGPACIFYRNDGGEVRLEQRSTDPALQSREFYADTNGPVIRFFATSDKPWLTLVSPMGQAPGTVSIRTDSTGLPPGVHRATVTLNGIPIPVKLTIHPVVSPVFTTDPPTTPPSAPNRRTFRIMAGSENQASDTSIVNVLINSSLDGARGCYLAYSNPARVLYLVNDQGPDAGLSAPLVLGSPGEVSNSQCRIHGATSSVTQFGRLLRLTLDVSFTPEFTGSKVIYAATRAADLGTSGWVLQDSLHLAGPETFPKALGALTTRYFGFGYGQRTDLTFTYEDATDANNLETVWGLINTGVDARSACYFAYYVPGDLLFLYPDDGNGAAAESMSLLGNRLLSNSQCTLLADGAFAEKSGRQLKLTVSYRFPNGFNLEKGVWGAAKSFTNPQASPWRILGSARLPQ